MRLGAELLAFSDDGLHAGTLSQLIAGLPSGAVELNRETWLERIHPEDRVKVMAKCQAALARGEDHELEYRALTATGDIVWLRDIVHVVPDAPGNAAQLRGLTVDLTDLGESKFLRLPANTIGGETP